MRQRTGCLEYSKWKDICMQHAIVSLMRGSWLATKLLTEHRRPNKERCARPKSWTTPNPWWTKHSRDPLSWNWSNSTELEGSIYPGRANNNTYKTLDPHYRVCGVIIVKCWAFKRYATGSWIADFSTVSNLNCNCSSLIFNRSKTYKPLNFI